MADENQQPNGNGKLAWFDRRMKAKLSSVAIALVTVAFYVVIFFKLELDYFVYYAAFISILAGAVSIADVLNTYSQSKYKPEPKP